MLAKREREGLGLAALKVYRAALFFAFRAVTPDRSVPLRWQQKLRRFFHGLRRLETIERQEGVRAPTSGKDAMPHALYVWLCDYFLRKGDTFAWVYLLLAWNTMSRTASVAGIALAHFTVQQDALGIYLPKTKNNQDGTTPRGPWHIFANPHDPRQCPITALGVALLLGTLRTQDKLFGGGNQERRFARALQGALASTGGKAMMADFGLAAGSITPHSIRKGAASYASSASTHGPSFPAIALRADWALGDVPARYFKYVAAMDRYLGRVLVGLDVNSPSFAALPPHFVPQAVRPAVLFRCFPSFKTRPAPLIGLLRFVLPSFLVHADALASRLPARHPLHGSVLLADAGLRQALAVHVVNAGAMSPHLQGTGIPPHVLLLVERPNPIPTPAAAPVAAPVATSIGAFPHDFALPSVGPLVAWRLLLRGNKGLGLPPYRVLRPEDFPGPAHRNLRKRISDWLYFAHAIMRHAPLLGDGEWEALQHREDESRLNELFLAAWSNIPFDVMRFQGRPDDWTVLTAVRKLRELEAWQAAHAAERYL